MPAWKVVEMQLKTAISSFFPSFFILSLSFLFAVCKPLPELFPMLWQLLMKQAVTSVLLRHMKGMIWRRKGQWQVSQKQHPACAALTRCETVSFILTILLIIKIHPRRKQCW